MRIDIMKVLIGKGQAYGSVNAPPSKSMAHRILILAGLSGKECLVRGIAESEDILATIDCLRALGAEIELAGDAAHVRGINLCVGSGESQRIATGELAGEGEKTEASGCEEISMYARESGSTLRFMIPIALLTGKMVHIGGSKRLLERPQTVYEELFARDKQKESQCESEATSQSNSQYRNQKIIFEKTENEIKVCGKLKPGRYELDGDVSSQFVTGLLLALPLLDGDSTIALRPPVESRSYIDMSLEALAMFGAEAVWQDENTLYIKGGQHYEPQAAYSECYVNSGCGKDQSEGGLAEVTVEGDYSNAAFFEALNYVGEQAAAAGCEGLDAAEASCCEEIGAACARQPASITATGLAGGGQPASVTVTGLSASSRQADRVYRELFERLAAGADSAGCQGGAIDIADCPDLGPILFAVAAALGGGHFTGTRRLKIKESDRAAAMAAELAKFGVPVQVLENEVLVGSDAEGDSEAADASPGLKTPTEELDGHNDHRIVMSLAVLCTLTGGVINGAEAVSKSFPDFFDRLESLGIEVKKLDN